MDVNEWNDALRLISGSLSFAHTEQLAVVAHGDTDCYNDSYVGTCSFHMQPG